MGAIEQAVLRRSARGMTKLLTELPSDFCARAANEILSWPLGKVALLTGFDVGGVPETDGPTGTYVMAKALMKLGYEPVVISEPALCAYFKELSMPVREVSPDDGTAEMGALLDELAPVGIVSVERCGRNLHGLYCNMRGVDISGRTSPVDELVVQAARRDIPTIGVGDGGNEIGMGNVAHAIARKLALEPCVVTVDNLVVATVSNWGAYGIAHAMGKQAGRSLLPAFRQISDFYRYIVERGSVDGTNGKRQVSVDGFTMEQEREVVEALRRA